LCFCASGYLVCRSVALRLPPPVGFHYLSGVGCGCKNLSYQSIGIKRNRRYQLVQLRGGQRRRALLGIIRILPDQSVLHQAMEQLVLYRAMTEQMQCPAPLGS